MNLNEQEAESYNVKNDLVSQAILILETQVKNDLERKKINGPHDLNNLLKLKYGSSNIELFGVIFLDQSNRVIDFETIEEGLESRTQVYIKKIAKRAFYHNATGVILVHNHPSYKEEFSTPDINLTKDIKTCFDILEIRTLDHLLVCGSNIVSMKEIIGMDF